MAVDSDDKYVQAVVIRSGATGDGAMSLKTDTDGDLALNTVVGPDQFNIAGAPKVYILDPDDGTTADADAERITDATGFKAFRVTPLSPGVANCLAIIYGWSTTASDLANVTPDMDALDADISTPSTAGQANENVGAILPTGGDVTAATYNLGQSPWITWDGSTTIKTIAVRSTGANYTTGVMVEVIV